MRQGAGIVAGGGGPSPTVRRRRSRSLPPPHEADDRRRTADEYEGRFGEDVVDRRGANSPHTESLSQSSGDGLSIGRPCTRSVVLDRCVPVSYTHLRAHETDSYLVCRLLLEKKKN